MFLLNMIMMWAKAKANTMVVLVTLVITLVACANPLREFKPHPSAPMFTPIPYYQVDFLKRHLGYVNLADCVRMEELGAHGDAGTNQTCHMCHWSSPYLDYKTFFKTDKSYGFIALDTSLNTIVVSSVGQLELHQLYEDLVDYATVGADCFGCQVNEYYYGEYLKVLAQIKDELAQLINEYSTARVVFTGYQLGAAVASLLALEFDDFITGTVVIITASGPPVGNSEFTLYFDAIFENEGAVWFHDTPVRQVFRLVNNQDAFCNTIPDGYSHYSGRILIRNHMMMQEDVLYAFDCSIINCSEIEDSPDSGLPFSLDTGYLEPLSCSMRQDREYVPLPAPTPPTNQDKLPLVNPYEPRPPYWQLF